MQTAGNIMHIHKVLIGQRPRSVLGRQEASAGQGSFNTTLQCQVASGRKISSVALHQPTGVMELIKACYLHCVPHCPC